LCRKQNVDNEINYKGKHKEGTNAQACQYARIANKANSKEAHVLPYPNEPHVLQVQHILECPYIKAQMPVKMFFNESTLFIQ
jgi:hypothetical protein